MSELIQDIRYAFRQLNKNRGFTVIAVLTLAIGIGANTAIFSVVNGVLLSPLPFPNAGRIVGMFQDKPNFPRGAISYPNFLDWQRDNRTFQAMAAYRWGFDSITGTGPAVDVPAQEVSATFFPILEVSPILGRNFNADEDRRYANPTIMISEGLWKRKFGGDPNILGKRIIVAGRGRTIIGVIPASFHLTIQNFRTADLYEPIGEDGDPGFYQRDAFWGMDAIGLLKPGVTVDQAREDMKRVNAGLAAVYPDINRDLKANIITLKDEMVGEMRPVLWVLLGAVGFVLLISCVNVANLLLARSTARQREFSIRTALGAGRGRLLQQLLSESVVLALIGGGLGLVLAKWGTAAAIAAVPRTVPRAEQIGLNLPVLLFTLIISLITGMAFGLVPALKASRTNVGETLKDAGRGIAGHRSRTQALFVIGEMAMALVLLVGAGLMLRTLMQLWSVDPGFDARNVLRFFLTPPPTVAQQPADAIRAEFRRIDSIIHSLPGVEAVSLQWGARPMESDDEIGFLPEGQQQPQRESDLPNGLEYKVEPQYLKTMRLPLLRGRFFSEDDTERSPRVAVIDSNFAQKYFPGQDPVGKRVSVFDFDSDPAQRTWIPMSIIGVVGHVNQWGLADEPLRPLKAQLYRPLMQGSDLWMKNFAGGVVVFVRSRAKLDSETLFQAIRQKLVASNTDMLVTSGESEEEVVARSIASQRFSLTLLSVFAGLALLLASVGIYGVLSYLVGQRTQEIGVRMALGAQRGDVFCMVLQDGARMALIGTAVGIIASLGLTRWMASMLFEVNSTDPITFGIVAILLCVIASFACYLPARRAAKLEPMLALRYE